MNSTDFVKSICKFAEDRSVLDLPPMGFHSLDNAIKYLISDIKFPPDIEKWDRDKISAYLQKTEGRKKYLEDWMIAKRHVLRESNYRKYQEALYKLHERYTKKIKALQGLLSKQPAMASSNNWFDQSKNSQISPLCR